MGVTDYSYSTKIMSNGVLKNFHNGIDISKAGNSDWKQNVYAGFSGKITNILTNTRTAYSSKKEWDDAKQTATDAINSNTSLNATQKTARIRQLGFFYNDSNELPSDYDFKYAKDTNTNIVSLQAGFNYSESGNSVFVDSGVKIRTMHFWDINATQNTFVAANDLIGTMGSTGYSSGVHLHIDMSTNAGQNTFLDW